MAKTTMNSFKRQFIAQLKGDDAEVLSEKAWRQAKAALTSHISSMEGDLIDKEENVASKEEELVKARVNRSEMITDRHEYILRLIMAKEALTSAKKKLEAHVATIDFLKEELANLKA